MNNTEITNAKLALGYRIRELRNNVINPETGKPISQNELGLRTGLTKKTVGQLERGKTNPEFETLLVIIQELNVTIKEFFNFDLKEYIKLAQHYKS